MIILDNEKNNPRSNIKNIIKSQDVANSVRSWIIIKDAIANNVIVIKRIFRKMNAWPIMKPESRTNSHLNIENILQFFIWLLEW